VSTCGPPVTCTSAPAIGLAVAALVTTPAILPLPSEKFCVVVADAVTTTPEAETVPKPLFEAVTV
jgi:hypothetical protein